MTRFIVGLVVALSMVLGVAAWASPPAGPSVQTLSFGKFARLTVYRSSPEPKNMVLFLSGDGGWNQGVVSMAKQLADQDATVVGIDIRSYLRVIEAEKKACSYPAWDFEQLSQFVQKKLGFKAYHRPVLVGYSSGATVAYALLAQAPRGTFLGAISLGFCPDLDIKHEWCKSFDLQYSTRADRKGVDFAPVKSITEPWYVLQGGQDQVCNPAATKAFVAQVPTGKIVELPNVGHGYGVERNWAPQFIDAFKQITEIAARPKAPTAALPAPRLENISGLPLVEVPATAGSSDTLTLIITGDGGWAGLDRGVANQLATRGIPTIGLDSLSYFWQERSPDETARAVSATLNHYLAAWHKQHVILVGYSFGGDVMPFVINRLPTDLKARVRLMTMIVPSQDAEFEFHVADWAGVSLGQTFPTLPEMKKVGAVRMLCIYGVEETSSLCPLLKPLNAKILGLPGGHHVGGDYARLAQEIVTAAQ